MMMVDSTTVRPSSTRSGKRANGQRAFSSVIAAGSSSDRYSNSTSFSYRATSTFWQYDEKGWE